MDKFNEGQLVMMEHLKKKVLRLKRGRWRVGEMPRWTKRSWGRVLGLNRGTFEAGMLMANRFFASARRRRKTYPKHDLERCLMVSI